MPKIPLKQWTINPAVVLTGYREYREGPALPLHDYQQVQSVTRSPDGVTVLLLVGDHHVLAEMQPVREENAWLVSYWTGLFHDSSWHGDPLLPLSVQRASTEPAYSFLLTRNVSCHPFERWVLMDGSGPTPEPSKEFVSARIILHEVMMHARWLAAKTWTADLVEHAPGLVLDDRELLLAQQDPGRFSLSGEWNDIAFQIKHDDIFGKFELDIRSPKHTRNPYLLDKHVTAKGSLYNDMFELNTQPGMRSLNLRYATAEKMLGVPKDYLYPRSETKAGVSDGNLSFLFFSLFASALHGTRIESLGRFFPLEYVESFLVLPPYTPMLSYGFLNEIDEGNKVRRTR